MVALFHLSLIRLHDYAENESQLLLDMAKSVDPKWAVLWGKELIVEELNWLLYPEEHQRRKNNVEEEQDHEEEDAEDANDALLDWILVLFCSPCI